jgi:hypothetical protein
MNLDITNTLSNYNKALEEINEYFDNVLGGNSPELMLEEYWKIEDRQLLFDNSNKQEDEELDFSHDIRGNMVWRKPGYTLVGVHDCFGDDFYIILSNDNELK